MAVKHVIRRVCMAMALKTSLSSGIYTQESWKISFLIHVYPKFFKRQFSGRFKKWSEEHIVQVDLRVLSSTRASAFLIVVIHDIASSICVKLQYYRF